MSLPVLLDTGGQQYRQYDRSLDDAYAPFPFQVVIDQQGVIRHVASQVDWPEMRSVIDELLAE